MKCSKCQNEIHPGRLKALPDARTCVDCSTTARWYVRSVISGKTEYSETEIIKNPETAEIMKAMDRRVGWGSNLIKVSR